MTSAYLHTGGATAISFKDKWKVSIIETKASCEYLNGE